MAQEKIVAAIPCHNEERHIGSVVTKAREYVGQVIVIDDGSSDRTAEVAETAGARVIKHEVNKGKGMAMNTALDEARRLDADILVFLDGDGQHNPDEIPVVLKPVLEGRADVVVGSRFVGKNSPIPRYRILGLYIITLVTNLGSGIRLTDSQSGFRALSRKAISSLHFSRTKVGDVECEAQFLIKRTHLRVTEVPIVVSYNDDVKRNPVAQGLGNLLTAIKLTIETRFRRQGNR